MIYLIYQERQVEKLKIVDFKILEKTSKKGNSYLALYAITSEEKEIFICFVNRKEL